MKKYILGALFLSTATMYGYEVYLAEIINTTPHDIIFTGREVSFPLPVPSIPPSLSPSMKTPSKPISFPIIIPARSKKLLGYQIVNQEESDSPAEIFLNFKDKNDNVVSIIARPGQIIKFAPLLGWQEEGIDLTNAKGTYHLSFAFKGKDGITDVVIRTRRPIRPTMEFQPRRLRHRY